MALSEFWHSLIEVFGVDIQTSPIWHFQKFNFDMVKEEGLKSLVLICRDIMFGTFRSSIWTLWHVITVWFQSCAVTVTRVNEVVSDGCFGEFTDLEIFLLLEFIAASKGLNFFPAVNIKNARQ